MPPAARITPARLIAAGDLGLGSTDQSPTFSLVLRLAFAPSGLAGSPLGTSYAAMGDPASAVGATAGEYFS